MSAAGAPLVAVALGLSDGPVDLFDGRSLDGWTRRGGPAIYRPVGGAIVGEAVPRSRNSFLCTDRSFGDFRLEFEVDVDPDLNSGVQIRSAARPEGEGERVFGYQVEVDPSGRAWSGGIYDEARRGWLNDLSANEAARRAFRVGEWNAFRVEAIGDRIRTWVNGVPAADLVDPMTLEGFVGLQVHGVGDLPSPKRVRWRHLRLEELGRSGWRPLFDGTTTGWVGHSLDARVDDGRLVLDAAAADEATAASLHRILARVEALADETLRLEFRLRRGAFGWGVRGERTSAEPFVGPTLEVDAETGPGAFVDPRTGRVVAPRSDAAPGAYVARDWNVLTL
ncbi:MAG: family 16 glycoside hydrolase, partial [Planctomycetota bacterium JB042]